MRRPVIARTTGLRKAGSPRRSRGPPRSPTPCDSLRAVAVTRPLPARGGRWLRTGDRGVAALSKELAAIGPVRRDLGRRLLGAPGHGLHSAGRRAARGRVVDGAGSVDRVRRARVLAGPLGRSRGDDRADDRGGDRATRRRRSRSGGGVGRCAEPDRGRMVSRGPTGPPGRDRRPPVPAPARRLSRGCSAY